ncbi:signal peptidase II [Rhizobium nepotum]|uniref:signal peptidase II n=1 Tax=Rhizobium nepotum TaxID=1035271 RepID=UPI00336A1DAD
MAKAALFSKFGPAFVLIVVALVLDQIVKQLVEAYLPLQEMIPVVPFLALYRTYNLGVAFSMLADMHGWFIVSMRLVIVVFVLWLWRKTAADRTFAHLGFAFIIAGAAGNLLDRFFYGHVIDYILFHTETWSFAVFNLADSFITIGAACVILDEFLHARTAKK